MTAEIQKAVALTTATEKESRTAYYPNLQAQSSLKPFSKIRAGVKVAQRKTEILW